MFNAHSSYSSRRKLAVEYYQYVPPQLLLPTILNSDLAIPTSTQDASRYFPPSSSPSSFSDKKTLLHIIFPVLFSYNSHSKLFSTIGKLLSRQMIKQVRIIPRIRIEGLETGMGGRRSDSGRRSLARGSG